MIRKLTEQLTSPLFYLCFAWILSQYKVTARHSFSFKEGKVYGCVGVWEPCIRCQVICFAARKSWLTEVHYLTFELDSQTDFLRASK